MTPSCPSPGPSFWAASGGVQPHRAPPPGDGPVSGCPLAPLPVVPPHGVPPHRARGPSGAVGRAGLAPPPASRGSRP
eukprot:2609186-Pleurochrysis_carterae.AAC.1